MHIPFREYHLIQILDAYDKQELPLDIVLCQYFRSHKALGSKDRGFIADIAYTLIRWRGLIDFHSSSIDWNERLKIFRDPSFLAAKDNMDIPLHTRLSFPQDLFQLIDESYGRDRAIDICRNSNESAPTVVRANALKCSREELMKRWSSAYHVSPCSRATYGILFHKKLNFFSLPEFRQGYFEVQDEGSQLVSELIQTKPGDTVLDYCAGSGGKTLAFAPRMEQKGQIYLHDIRHHALQEARRRLRRAGIQNAQIISSECPHLKKLKKRMDWVIVDAPCSGTGTLRRNPDMKWRFNLEMLKRLMGQQRTIFEKALSFLKPDGRIVYITCSILPHENRLQVEHFLHTYSLQLEGDYFEIFPTPGGPDGFFASVLKRA